MPAEPREPGDGLPPDISNMTIAEIKAFADAPAHKATWAEYERNHAAWKAKREALREKFVAPAKAKYEAAVKGYAAAFNALTTYRVSTLSHLREKIQIIYADYDGADIPHEYVDDILADARRLCGER